MNKPINTILLFGYIGVIPTFAGWYVIDWQWWAVILPLWIGIWWRDALDE